MTAVALGCCLRGRSGSLRGRSGNRGKSTRGDGMAAVAFGCCRGLWWPGVQQHGGLSLQVGVQPASGIHDVKGGGRTLTQIPIRGTVRSSYRLTVLVTGACTVLITDSEAMVGFRSFRLNSGCLPTPCRGAVVKWSRDQRQ